MNMTTTKYVRCTAKDIFTVSGEGADDLIQKADAYFSIFAVPVFVDGKRVCISCGSFFDGLMQMVGLISSYAAFKWGAVHGEAHCSKCHAPARGMHYPKDGDGDGQLFSLTNFFLEYLPDDFEQVAPGSMSPEEQDQQETFVSRMAEDFEEITEANEPTGGQK